MRRLVMEFIVTAFQQALLQLSLMHIATSIFTASRLAVFAGDVKCGRVFITNLVPWGQPLAYKR